MKKMISVFTVLTLFVSMQTNAQNNFETAMRDLHLKAVNTCGMVKSQNGHDKDKIIASFNELKTMASEVQKNYVNSRPNGYTTDPLFASYFVQLNDIADHQIALVEKENYQVATMNCSQFCMTFKKMHAINGTTDLTDLMFDWNMQINMTMFMINADNLKGTQMSFTKIPEAYQKVIAFKTKKADAEFSKSFEKVDSLYNEWNKAMVAKDYAKAKKVFGDFKAAFPMVFKQSI